MAIHDETGEFTVRPIRYVFSRELNRRGMGFSRQGVSHDMTGQVLPLL
jgi:hypothetical protein